MAVLSTVAAGGIIDPAWGNSAATSINGFESIATWAPTTITQGVSVSCTPSNGFSILLGNVFIAKVRLVISSSGTSGSSIQVPVPYTLANALTVGGSFYYVGAAGQSVGAVASNTTTTFVMVVDGATTLGNNPAFGLVNNDNLDVTVIGRRA